MVQSIGNSNGYSNNAEYMRIMQELRSFGISPSGNQAKDAQKLNEAKNQLVQRLQQKEDIPQAQQDLGVQVINQVDESEFAKRSELEEQRLGAMNIAELNKFYFGL